MPQNTQVSSIVLRRYSSYYYLPVLGSLLFAIWLVYSPGLHGDFLFDDYANLPALGAFGAVDTWPNFWRYITSGAADPTGRPLAMLSFLLDAHDWPAAPYPFKRTNLILHLLNAALLTCLFRELGRALICRDKFYTSTDLSIHSSPTSLADNTHIRVDIAAVISAALWALHPLFVSTTLYIVQREAMLPATCTLLGMLLWLYGRERLRRGKFITGASAIVLGAAGFSVLGVLSKANGALLPIYILLTEYVLLQDRRPMEAIKSSLPSTHLYRRLLVALVWLPAIFVIGYLLFEGWLGLTQGIGPLRPWTLGERLLTEPRVLFDYLRLLWLPKPFTSGLFNEQIQVSSSLWVPMTTLPALLGLIALLGFAWKVRRTWPAISLAILFFFAGQLMESSTIALELYYEHRNYVPALLMFWPLALWLCGVRQATPRNIVGNGERNATPTAGTTKSPQGMSKLKAVMAVTLLAGLASMTHANAVLWGNAHDQALMWATLNPWSPRAQANAAQEEIAHGQPQRAIERLTPLLQQHPDQVQIAFNLLGAKCMLGGVSDQDVELAGTALGTARDPGTLLVNWSDRAIAMARNGQCHGFGFAMLQRLLDRGLVNPYFAAGRKQDILHIQGNIALAQRNPIGALHYFDAALAEAPRISLALDQAAQLGDAGYPEYGIRHLAYYDSKQDLEVTPSSGMPRVHAWVLQHQGYWNNELVHLRSSLQNDANHQSEKDPPSS